MQNRYNLSDRSSEGVLAECEQEGIAFLPWRPLEAGGHGTGALATSRVDTVQRPSKWR